MNDLTLKILSGLLFIVGLALFAVTLGDDNVAASMIAGIFCGIAIIGYGNASTRSR